MEQAPNRSFFIHDQLWWEKSPPWWDIQSDELALEQEEEDGLSPFDDSEITA